MVIGMCLPPHPLINTERDITLSCSKMRDVLFHVRYDGLEPCIISVETPDAHSYRVF